MATELAKAYVQIIPSAKGISGSIENVLSGESSKAGEKAGESIASKLGGALKKGIIALGIGKMVTDAIMGASEFESSMAKVSTLFTGSTAEFADLQSKILSLSSETGMAATTLGEAAYSALSASVPMDDLGHILERSSKLAIAGFTDVDTALSATAKTMNAYGMTGRDAINSVQKVLIQTQNKGITTVGELGASLAQVTPTAAAMGVSFEQVGAAMALMTAKGTPTAQATTQLRSAMAELGKSGTKASKAFEKATKGTELAGKSFKQVMAEGHDLGEVMGIMQEYANKTGVSMVDMFSSIEAGVIYALLLPPGTSLVVALTGVLFGSFVVKQFFGGAGNNILNPACVARLCVEMIFPSQMSSFKEPLTSWFDVMSLTGRTDGVIRGDDPQSLHIVEIITGNYAGYIGTGCALLILCAWIYLLVKGTVRVYAPSSYLVMLALLYPFMREGLSLNSEGFKSLGIFLLSSGALFIAVYMLGDFTTMPSRILGGVFAGVICAVMTAVLYGRVSDMCAVLAPVMATNFMSFEIDFFTKTIARRGKFNQREVKITK